MPPSRFSDGTLASGPYPPPSQAVEDTTATPIRCYVCLGNPAVLIPIGGHLGQFKGFCSERCAAIHGLRTLRDSDSEWCNTCNTWTEENGVCHLCGQRWTISPAHAACDDGPFDDEESGVAHDA